jgi:hypothetical protein
MDGVRAAVLTRLGDASASQRRDWDWLLELDVELPVRDWLEEWLGDLRLLGSRRAVVVAGERIPLEET